jgi:hypothetical protein
MITFVYETWLGFRSLHLPFRNKMLVLGAFLSIKLHSGTKSVIYGAFTAFFHFNFASHNLNFKENEK